MRYILALILIGGLSSPSFAWPRRTRGATIVTQNSGDRAGGFSVTVTSGAALAVYTASDKHREILLQNTNATYTVFCGTFSAVTADAGVPRFALPPFPTGFTTNGTYSLWCASEDDAGTTAIEIIGSYEYDSGDGP